MSFYYQRLVLKLEILIYICGFIAGNQTDWESPSRWFKNAWFRRHSSGETGQVSSNELPFSDEGRNYVYEEGPLK